jgi:hypothetical protein
MQPTPEEPATWPNQIEMIHRSLDAVCALEPTVAYCGHGEPVANVAVARERILQRHNAKQKKILEAIQKGATNLFQINQSINTFKTPVEQFIEIFETLHHLNCLMSRQLIKKEGFAFSLS